MTNEELTMAILKSAEAIKKDIQPNELLNYITNLQKENKKLKDYYNDNVNNYEELLEKYSTIQILYNSSKLKNDKAIKYIKNNCYYLVDNDDKNLLNILQNGGDK